jgi:hypothetical protein
MKCPSCGSSKFLVESIGDGKSRGVCSDCRWSNIIDQQGRQFLTDEKSSHFDRQRILTETR